MPPRDYRCDARVALPQVPTAHSADPRPTRQSSRHRARRGHAPFQRAPNAGADLRMAPPDLVEHRNGPNAGSRLQDWHDLAVPNLGQWVRTPAASWRFLLRWQPRIIVDAVAGCPAEAGLGGSNGGIFAMSVNHVQPHLVVGDVKAGQSLIPQFRDESDT